MSSSEFADMTRDVLNAFGAENQPVTLHLADGVVSAHAYIHLESILIGDERGVLERQWIAHIDMGHGKILRRGDRLETSAGESCLLAERIDDDEWCQTWALEAK